MSPQTLAAMAPGSGIPFQNIDAATLAAAAARFGHGGLSSGHHAQTNGSGHGSPAPSINGLPPIRQYDILQQHTAAMAKLLGKLFYHISKLFNEFELSIYAQLQIFL